MSEAEPTLEECLKHARTGDGNSLGILLQQYRPYLMLLARLEIGQRLQGKVDVADVVQDTFLDAARQFPQFRGSEEHELTAWLRRILAGTLAMLMRRFFGTQARDPRLERTLSDELDESSRAMDLGLVAKGSSPSQAASRREEAVILANALELLPVDYREVIVLRNLEGLTFPEVAARMQRSPASVERLWARALPKLKRALEGRR